MTTCASYMREEVKIAHTVNYYNDANDLVTQKAELTHVTHLSLCAYSIDMERHTIEAHVCQAYIHEGRVTCHGPHIRVVVDGVGWHACIATVQPITPSRITRSSEVSALTPQKILDYIVTNDLANNFPAAE